MEVVLVDGFGIELSIKGMQLYLKRANIDGWFYAMPDYEEGGGSRQCERIDEEYDFTYGDPFYYVADADLGKFASLDDVHAHELGLPIKPFSRTDKILISVLRELGGEAQGHCALYIADIPDYIEWHIESDSDGFREYAVEGVFHNHDRWYGEPIWRAQ